MPCALSLGAEEILAQNIYKRCLLPIDLNRLGKRRQAEEKTSVILILQRKFFLRELAGHLQERLVFDFEGHLSFSHPVLLVKGNAQNKAGMSERSVVLLHIQRKSAIPLL